jgi:transposase
LTRHERWRWLRAVSTPIEVFSVQPIYAMSDALWERAQRVLLAIDLMPSPAARTLLDAIIYRALTGAAWDDLPASYPASEAVAEHTARWRDRGVLAQLEAVVLVRLC